MKFSTRILTLQIFNNGELRHTSKYYTLAKPTDIKDVLHGVLSVTGYNKHPNATLLKHDYVDLVSVIKSTIEMTNDPEAVPGTIHNKDHYEGDKLIILLQRFGDIAYLTFGTVDGKLVPGRPSR